MKLTASKMKTGVGTIPERCACSFVSAGCIRVLLSLYCLLAGCVTPSPVAFINAELIHRDIAFLADDRFQGRFCRSDEAREVADYLADRFRAAGCEPVAGGDGFFHGVQDPAMAPNVIARRPGRGGGIVLITAHYDHLKPASTGTDRIYNGADDNASGVAGVLAIADALHRSKFKTEASIIFIAFTGEEAGLRGSRHVAGAPPFKLADVRAMFNMDMISRGEEDLIFIDGGKEAGPLREALRRANDVGRLGLRMKFDEHPDWLMRSDQGPFIKRNVPAVLFSVEDHPDYHQVTDHADRVLPKLAERVSKSVLLATMELAGKR